MATDAESDWFDRIPKVELHCHLEGAIPRDFLWQLIQRHGGDPTLRKRSDLDAHFRFHDFAHFIQTWVWKNRFLRTPADFADVASAVARSFVAHHIVYAELFFSPADFAEKGLGVAELACAIRSGLRRVPEVEVNLIADLVRDFGPDRALATLDALEDVRDQGVIGIGLGGSEREHPARAFTEVFARARERGWHLTAHAGEADGAASVRAAVELLHVERIGHGIHAIDDAAVVRLLIERGVALEVCPLSNLATGVVRDLAHHPITRLCDAGVAVTVNTDDPGMFGNTLAGEFRALTATRGGGHGWTRAQVRQATLAAVDASWLPSDGRAGLRRRILNDPAWA